MCSARVLGTCARHVCSAPVLGTCARHVCSARVLGTCARHVCSARVLGTCAIPRRPIICPRRCRGNQPEQGHKQLHGRPSVAPLFIIAINGTEQGWRPTHSPKCSTQAAGPYRPVVSSFAEHILQPRLLRALQRCGEELVLLQKQGVWR